MTTARIAKGASRTPRRNIVKATSGKPQQRRQSEALLAGQNRVLEGLVKGASLNAVLETLIRVIEAHSAGVIGSILVCEPGEERFGLAIAPGLPADYAALLETARTSPPFFGPCSMAVHRSEIVACDDIAADVRWSPQWRDLVLAHGLARCRSIPIVSPHGGCLGSFGLYLRHAGTAFPDSDVLAAMADLAAIAIERKRTEQALRDSEARLEAELADSRLLQAISSQLIGERSDDVLYEKLIDAAAQIMRSDYASMQILDPERGSGGELRLLAFRGFAPEAARFWQWVRADSQSTCGAALRTGQRVIVPDIEQCAFMAGTDDLRTYRGTGIRAVQTTPLLSRTGTTVGMISTHWSVPHEPSERQLRLLDVVARQAADLIDYRNAQEGVRQREERLRAIFDSAAIGAAILTPDTRFIQVNGAFSTITGYSIQELRALDCSALTHPDDWTEMRTQLDELLAGRTPSFVIEKRYLRKDGSLIWVQNSVSLTRDAAGEPLHLVKLCQDITERRQAQEALSLSNAQLRAQADELARFNRAAVDRELRMIELKKAINALSEHLGDRPPHALAFETDARAAND